MPSLPLLSRRQTFGFGAAGFAGLALSRAAPAQVGPATLPEGACALMPHAVEGPYYFDAKMQRTDITDGHAGIPLGLNLRILGPDCTPIPNARVDVWHCDAQGLYSGYDGQSDTRDVSTKGQTFLRGTQFAGPGGDVSFATVYPGWYRGRTTHMHYKVFLDTKTVLTGQIFLPDALNEFVYANAEAYKRPGQRDTLNALDGIARMATDASQAMIREERIRYVAALTVAVDPNTIEPSGENGPGGMPFGPPPPGGHGPGDHPPGPPPGMPGGPPGFGGPSALRLTPPERLKALIPGPDRLAK